MAVTQNRRPNILLILSDDHGLEAGCYGNQAIRTPHMDRLAAEGVRFTSAFCTCSTCSPSRSVILTGLHNHANGMYGLQHRYHHFQSFDGIDTLPVLIAAAGYRTAHIGKFHVGPTETYRFEHFLEGDGRSPVEMAENCREFLSDDAEKPFFLYYCTNDPHRGGGVAEDLPGKPDRFGNRDEGYPGVNTITYRPEDVEVPPFLPDNIECRAELAQYYQSVSRMDQGIGRLVDILKECGEYDNTVIIYLSDNGFAFPEAKTTLYDMGMRLPLIVRSPEHAARGTTCDAMVTWADITPTILDFAHVRSGARGNTGDDIPAFHGRSFRGVIDESEPKGWDEVFASHTFHEVTMYYPMRVARDRKHKFIWNLAHGLEYPIAADLWRSATWQSVIDGGLTHLGARPMESYIRRPRCELYDLESDPLELKNLANDPEYSGLVDEYMGKLKAFQERTDDPWIIKWSHE